MYERKGNAENMLVMTVAPQKDICPQGQDITKKSTSHEHPKNDNTSSSYDKTKKPNGKHSVDHPEITENGFMAEPRYDMR